MPLDLPNIAQNFQEREHLNQICSAVWFMFSVLDHLPSQRVQGGVEGAPVFILVTSDGVRATEVIVFLGLMAEVSWVSC